ncbi:MAG TPA: SLATT domain-containing protein [Thermoleophilaceae bacterium]|jgi:hypothetical protein
MSADLDPGKFPRVSWSQGQLGDSLQAVYEWVDGEAERTARWYLDEKRPKARRSRRLRGLAILFASAGAAVPFVNALASDVELELGYLLFAVAAAFVGFDRFFGYSTAWMRYLTAEQRIESVRTQFQFRWAAALAEQGDDPLTAEAAVRLLDVLREAAEAIAAEVQSETATWISEFRTNMAELRQLAAAPSHESAAAGAAAPAPAAVPPAPAEPPAAGPPEPPDDLPERG